MFKKAILLIVYGIVTIMMSYLVGFIIKPFFTMKLNPVCKDWNKKHVMEYSLFLTGVLTFLLFMIINKYLKSYKV